MNAREFKEIRNRVSALTPAQERRLAADLQESTSGEELPEQVRQRETELDRLRICRHCGTKGVCASQEVGRPAPVSMPLGVLRTDSPCLDRDETCWPEAEVEMVHV